MKLSHLPPLERRCLTLSEVAAELALNPRRIRQLAAEGKVPRIELGWRTHLYEPEAVLAALKRIGGAGSLG